jgi:hypothetical protein
VAGNGDSQQSDPEEQGLVLRLGPVEMDWAKTIGYYGGVGLAVAFELVEPPLALFIAAIPLIKLLKYPRDPGGVRVAAAILEGASKPVGGDAESVVRVVSAGNQGGGRKRR